MSVSPVATLVYRVPAASVATGTVVALNMSVAVSYTFTALEAEILIAAGLIVTTPVGFIKV